jgi:sugar diacid utilization regulator
LKAGISNEFDDIFKVKSFFLQAEKAYETGFETDPSNSIYHFKDYAVPYILAQYGNELPLEMICCEGLMRLREYEKDSSVEYFKTLITYMRNNMNAIKTSKDLYIHRSTMLFRLNRIKEILQMDLNDPDQRLYLEISLRLIGKNKF